MPEKPTLESRVARAAGEALLDQGYARPIDVLMRIGWLQASHLMDWRGGRATCLEEAVPVSSGSVAQAVGILDAWAHGQNLKTAETRYERRSRKGLVALRFTSASDPEAEQKYRRVWLSPDLSRKEREKILRELNTPPDIVVFSILRNSKCSACGAEKWEGDFLFKDGDEAFCLACAGLDRLEYLPSGDAALTRRAKKYSKEWAVVVSFSRSRKRYERRGLLVEPEALAKADNECAPEREAPLRR